MEGAGLAAGAALCWAKAAVASDKIATTTPDLRMLLNITALVSGRSIVVMPVIVAIQGQFRREQDKKP
jgi:drug/metabolite transporter (DMT)-like permease